MPDTEVTPSPHLPVPASPSFSPSPSLLPTFLLTDADLAMESFDPVQIRRDLRRDLTTTHGCRVEVVMKDNHTIRGNPGRVVEWVRIAREEAEALGAV